MRRGEITYAALLASSDRAAGVLLDQGLSAGDRVGVLCRNHLALVELLGGASTAGIDVVLLNTGLVARQVSQVVERESISFVAHDDEFVSLVANLSVPCLTESRFTALLDESALAGAPVRPRRASRVVVLTSGTTGRPKGARRPHPRSLSGLASVLDRIPLRPRERVLLSAPIFHTWGFGGLQLALAMRDMIVLQRRFAPGPARDALAEHRCQVMFAVPVMLQRMLALGVPPRDIPADRRGQRVVSARWAGDPLHDGLRPVLYNEEFRQRLVAHVVPEPGAQHLAADVLRHVGSRVARHSRPREVVVVEELPRNETGKVLIRQLRHEHGDLPRALE